ncbi:MAG: hypothetical protein AAGF55_02280 [Pseudomonadota bacterium]
MTLQKLLETFDSNSRNSAGSGQGAVLDAAQVEAIRQQGYEEGYASGWDDATASETEARRRVDAELERNIQNLAFTYNEAVDRVRGEVKTFVSAIVERFFPDLLLDLTREHVRAELVRIADAHVEAPLEIVSAPDAVEVLKDMLENDFSLEIELVSDENLAPRQVFVRSKVREIEVDLSPLLTAIREQFEAIQITEEKAVNDE